MKNITPALKDEDVNSTTLMMLCFSYLNVQLLKKLLIYPIIMNFRYMPQIHILIPLLIKPLI